MGEYYNESRTVLEKINDLPVSRLAEYQSDVHN
jgi:hypothetical protein